MAGSTPEPGDGVYRKQTTWSAAIQAARTALNAAALEGEAREQEEARAWQRLQDDFPAQWDWIVQDSGNRLPTEMLGGDAGTAVANLRGVAIAALEAEGAALRERVSEGAAARGGDLEARDWDLYFEACAVRRASRLKAWTSPGVRRVVFVRRHIIRPSFFAYTEGQSDAQNERHFLPGSALCWLEWEGGEGRVRALVEDATGVIRDPAVSWDGSKILFAWKKSLDEDDYHLYEWDLEKGGVRQLTFGLGYADYEGAYLPNGEIVFASTRCVQTVDCWWTEVSNLYACDADGGHLRRLGFDQVHTVFPSVLDDGRVIYTRWDYNDRGQIFPQALFQMYPDGTGQTEYYGNNSWFPTTPVHARGIPGTGEVLATLCGHHTAQSGKLARIDPARGRQENHGVQLIAPVRSTPAERIDGYGQDGDLFQYPFPLTATEFLVSYAPLGWGWREGHFAIYWMDEAGRRELLASDPRLPCAQPVVVAPRALPPVRPSLVDHARSDGVYYLHDIYAGPGLEGVPRGTIRRLRVVALEYRAAGVGFNCSAGPSGEALICTPVAIGNGSWDVKAVLGETPVHADGSAAFRVPARMPVYFQAIDPLGFVAQTMRSWSTLQPGEMQSCVGCHEHKNTAPPVPAQGVPLALRESPKALEPFQGPARGFSFAREVQPILNRHCTRCHNDRTLQPPAPGSRSALVAASGPDPQDGESPAPRAAFSLLGERVLDHKAKRYWSDAYLVLTEAHRGDFLDGRGILVGNPGGRWVNWISSQSVPEPLPAYAAGAARSGLFRFLDEGHNGVRLAPAERATLACWIDLLVPFCGDYREANAWSEADLERYEQYARKRSTMEALEQRNLRSALTRE
ncbi:MAG TPA: hypothetical protein PKJ98_07710 [Verrucomicrobiota bacterium]|nr:hypothetical protein [Verrucomicrobiota bacterium]